MGSPFSPFDAGGGARPNPGGPSPSGSPFGAPGGRPPFGGPPSNSAVGQHSPAAMSSTGSSPFGSSPFGTSESSPFTQPATPSASASTLVTSPTAILAVAIGIALFGLILGAYGWGTILALVGWVLAGPIAIGTMAYFVQQDSVRRTDPNYLIRPNLNLYYIGAAVSAFAGIVVTAVSAALWVGHL